MYSGTFLGAMGTQLTAKYVSEGFQREVGVSSKGFTSRDMPRETLLLPPPLGQLYVGTVEFFRHGDPSCVFFPSLGGRGLSLSMLKRSDAISGPNHATVRAPFVCLSMPRYLIHLFVYPCRDI